MYSKLRPAREPARHRDAPRARPNRDKPGQLWPLTPHDSPSEAARHGSIAFGGLPVRGLALSISLLLLALPASGEPWERVSNGGSLIQSGQYRHPVAPEPPRALTDEPGSADTSEGAVGWALREPGYVIDRDPDTES